MRRLTLLLLAPLAFAGLAACEIGSVTEVQVTIPCPRPFIFIQDTLAFGDWNRLCPYWTDSAGVRVLTVPGV